MQALLPASGRKKITLPQTPESRDSLPPVDVNAGWIDPCPFTNPFAGLAFSSAPAFMWDNAKSSVIWINSAGRQRLFSRNGTSIALSAATCRRLTRLSETLHRKPGGEGRVRVKAAGKPQLMCCAALIEVAGGHNGLAVKQSEAATPQPETLGRKKNCSVCAPSAENSEPRPAFQIAGLSASELAALKSIGRRVRKLCRERLANDGREQRNLVLIDGDARVDKHRTGV